MPSANEIANEIRVMIVDDHPVTRKGLRDILEDYGCFDVVGEAADGDDAVRKAQDLHPDVIVMDVLMPRMNGIEACRDILNILPDTRVLVLTASSDEEVVIRAMSAGATGFVQKYSDADGLVAAVRGVAEGRMMVPDHAVRRAFHLLSQRTEEQRGFKALTNREQEILTLFANGSTYDQIARARGVNMTTVRNSIYRIQDKLGVNSKQEMVVWAVRNGLLDSADARTGPGTTP